MSRKGCLFAIGILVASTIAFVLWVKYGEFWEIDYCYDSGGYWDRAREVCER